MSDFKSGLQNGEDVVATARIHGWVRWQSWLILLLCFCLAADGWNAQRPHLVRMIAVLVLCFGVCSFIELMLRYCSERAVVTTRRVLYKARLFSRAREIPLKCIEGVRIRQSVWARNMGYGSIHIQGAGSEVVDIPAVRDPVAFRAVIETARGH